MDSKWYPATQIVSDEWKKLYRDVQIAVGMEEDENTTVYAKMNYSDHVEPGAKVVLKWKIDVYGKGEEARLLTDTGYLFVMPDIESEDPLISGIVHVPKPAGGEKCQPEAEWHTLYELERNPQIFSITIRNENV